MTELRTLMVPDGLAGDRVDAALARMLGMSRAKVCDLIADGLVTTGGKTMVKADKVEANMWIDVELPPAPTAPQIVPEKIDDMRIIHDDEDIVVVSKPVGVAAHPSPGWSGPTVVGGLAGAGYRISTSGIHERQGVVHRLDVGTSGLMAVAKSERAYTIMKQAFRDRRVDKTYETVVQGHPDPMTGTIDAPIGRNPKGDGRMAVTAKGKPSITHYETLEAFPRATWLRVHLETGRTHQIRVHMQALKHPCVGDLSYGADPKLAKHLGLTRQWLHAVQLGFDHPGSGKRVEFRDELPADLAAALDRLRPQD